MPPFKIQLLTKDITVSANATPAYNLGDYTLPEGYTYAGIIPIANGFGDQWTVTYGNYGGNAIYAKVKNWYNTNLSAVLKCNVLFLRSDLL